MTHMTSLRRGRSASARRAPEYPRHVVLRLRRPPWRSAAVLVVLALLSMQLDDGRLQNAFAAWGESGARPANLVASSSDRDAARFGLCHAGGGSNCVVDGDTIYYRGVKIRIADIDTPETHQPRCPAEARLGAQATQRLHALVNAGPFTLESVDRDEDRFGRKLRVLTRGGESLGGVLVREGLARWYRGGRQPWC